MTSLRRYDSGQMDWQKHPTVPSIRVKVFESRATGTAYDAAMVQLASSEWINWHRHPESSETIYVVQGTGLIFGVADEAQQADAVGLDIAPGVVVTIPVGLHHAVHNTSDQIMLIMAVHSPPTL